MTINKKLIALGLSSLKTLLGVASTISLIFSGAGAHAAPAQTHLSPLLGQSQVSQIAIANMVEAIRNAAGGTVDAASIGKAIQDAVNTTPGVTRDIVAAAVNQLNLDDPALNEAVATISLIFGVPPHEVVTALITDMFMKDGKDAAARHIAHLRLMLGDAVVNRALENIPPVLLSDGHDLAAIEPASGLYDG